MAHFPCPGVAVSLPRPLLVLAVAGLVLFAPPALAVDAPRQMTFQGRLLRADGSPETLPQDLRFALYATPSGGAPLWEETHLGTSITNGYYAVVLGTSTPLPAAAVNGQALYLGVSLIGQSELTPRLTVASVPYALLANDSNALQGRPASSFADASHTHASVPLADDSNKLQGRAAASFADATHTHAPATPTANGFMATADKTKLNGLPSTYGAGLGFNTNNSTLSVNFGSSGTATTAARSDHTHPSPTLSCTYRIATGNIDTGKNSTAWCAATDLLMGGGCSDLNGASTGTGITFSPTGVTTQDGSTQTAGPGYTCRLPNPPTGASIPTAYAICCRIP
jgi:hypothetical protein